MIQVHDYVYDFVFSLVEQCDSCTPASVQLMTCKSCFLFDLSCFVMLILPVGWKSNISNFDFAEHVWPIFFWIWKLSVLTCLFAHVNVNKHVCESVCILCDEGSSPYADVDIVLILLFIFFTHHLFIVWTQSLCKSVRLLGQCWVQSTKLRP